VYKLLPLLQRGRSASLPKDSKILSGGVNRERKKQRGSSVPTGGSTGATRGGKGGRTEKETTRERWGARSAMEARMKE